MAPPGMIGLKVLHFQKMNDVEIYHCTQYQLVVRCNLFQSEFRAINDCNLVIKFTTKQLHFTALQSAVPALHTRGDTDCNL